MSSNSEVKSTIERSWCFSRGFSRGNQKLCQWGFVPLLKGDIDQMQKVKGQQKVHQYYTIIVLILLQIEESVQTKIIPDMVDP